MSTYRIRLGSILTVLAGLAVGLWIYRGGAGKAPSSRPGGKGASVKELRSIVVKLRSLHAKLGKPRPGDWLARFPEPGQTFAQYLRSRPVVPRGKRRVIYVQPLGQFTKAQRRVVTLTADYLGRYFSLPVKVNKDMTLGRIPAKARRTHPTWGDKQILTTYVLDKVLRPQLPDDAFGMIALTGSDLWPGKGWNFVFGQASLRDRVGIWSIYRFGDPDKDKEGFRQVLLRTVKTATHELGHMLSMLHCTAYECNMCGSNSLGESDRRPLALCPECVAKVCWATRADVIERYGKLAAFCKAHGLEAETKRFEGFIVALGAAPVTTRPPR